MVTGYEHNGKDFLEKMKRAGMTKAGIKRMKYCLIKYKQGEETGYNFKNAFDAFLLLIQFERFKHFYDFFSIIDDGNNELFEIVFVTFMSINDIKKKQEDIFRFLFLECLRRDCEDLIRHYIRPLMSYRDMTKYIYADNLDRVINFVKIVTNESLKGDESACYVCSLLLKSFKS